MEQQMSHAYCISTVRNDNFTVAKRKPEKKKRVKVA